MLCPFSFSIEIEWLCCLLLLGFEVVAVYCVYNLFHGCEFKTFLIYIVAINLTPLLNHKFVPLFWELESNFIVDTNTKKIKNLLTS